MKLVNVVAAAATVIAVTVAAPPSASAAGVDPGTVSLTLAPGASAAFPVRVTTPAVAPNPDIVFLADTTGGMDPALANVRNNVTTMIGEVRAAQPDARFAVAEYKEQADGDRVFTVDTPLTDDGNLVQAGTAQWLYNVGGGGAPWTDFVNAHYRIATDAVAFRPGGSRIVLWLGDAVSHDPSLGHTIPNSIAALQAAGARVVAVPVVGTTGDGLDHLGQASSIVAATRGRLMPDSTAGQVADALLTGLHSLDLTVTHQVSCDPALSLTFDAASRTVRSGSDASFAGTAGVRSDAEPGTYRCTVDYLVEGITQGLTQTVTVTVPGGSVPVLSVADVSVAEGNSGTASAVFTVSLDGPAAGTVTVHVATADGTAVAPADFTATSVDLTFAAGETTKQVAVPAVGDTVVEPDETFVLNLSSASGATVADGQGVGTIRNDDEPVVPRRLSVGDVMVAEGNSGTTSAVFTVSLDGPAAGAVTVHAVTANGTAVAPSDFTATSADLTFAVGETSKQVTVPVVGDTVLEPDETFSLGLSAASGADLADSQGVGTIQNDDGPAPRLSVGDVAVTEGNTGTTQAGFMVSLDHPSAGPVTVHAATANGTAVAPGDFTATSVDLAFAAGETSKQVVVPVVGDTVVEQDETFVLELSSATGASVADGQGVGTIRNDDELVVPRRLSVGDVSVAEGDSGTTDAVFTVSLDGPAAGPVTMHAATANGTAMAPADFTATSVDLTFAAGETTKQVRVPVVGDTDLESDETFAVGLSAVSGADVLDGQGVGTILNDDVVRPRLSIGDVTVAEGNAGATSATFTVSLDRTSTAPVAVHYRTVSGTATAGQDFGAVSGDVLFLPGQASQQVTVAVVGDTVDEPDETFTVHLSAPTGAAIADGDGVGTIVDDDEPVVLPAVSVNDVTVSESAGTATFTVSLDRTTTVPVSVHYATADGTATAGSDYGAAAGDLLFLPGQATRPVTVTILGDPLDEPDETLTVRLSAPSGATIADGAGAGTITDDDRNGRFDCRASALTVLGSQPTVANPAGVPCADAAKAAPSATLGSLLLGVRLTGGTVGTDQTPDDPTTTPAAGDNATATTELATTRITATALTIEIGAITSRATARCVPATGGLVPSLSGTSTIGSLRINGVRVPIGDGPVTIPLVIGSLKLNSTTSTATSVTQRAVELHTLLGDVVLGEARAGVQGTPAHPTGSPCAR